jgi:bifunctional DNA-binding transcriptional regulator/antitoxin component of YhaV-PrlF toxin-antitoxin module
LFFVVGDCVEEFVVRVFTGGKVTVPKQLRERFGVLDGDYVRLVLVEVFKKGEDGEWVKKKVP